MMWGDHDVLPATRQGGMANNQLPHMRGIAPVSPDPKMHFNQLHN